jgi:hypothetical protein
MAFRTKRRQAALLWRAQAIYQRACSVIEARGGYEDPQGLAAYVHVIMTLNQAMSDLDSGKIPPGARSQGCTTDDDCGPEQICVEGACQEAFPPV